jgi:hypothetical protein
MDKRPGKIIPWRQHHLCLGVAARKPNLAYRHAEKVGNDIVIILIFIRVVMKKANPPIVAAKEEEKEEEINLQYQET